MRLPPGWTIAATWTVTRSGIAAVREGVTSQSAKESDVSTLSPSPSRRELGAAADDRVSLEALVREMTSAVTEVRDAAGWNRTAP